LYLRRVAQRHGARVVQGVTGLVERGPALRIVHLVDHRIVVAVADVDPAILRQVQLGLERAAQELLPVAVGEVGLQQRARFGDGGFFLGGVGGPERGQHLR
jgi:hypothetical protein